jgi:hypothetical protein
VFSAGERKVAAHFNESFPDMEEGNPEFEEQKRRVTDYRNQLRTTLEGIYSEAELDDLYSRAWWFDDHLIMRKLAGRDYPLIRRIRNAYLPGMTDLITLQLDAETGEVVGAEDNTYQLFDGPGDAVSQIEKILGIEDNK